MVFATAITCMDGRVQGAVRKYMKKRCGVNWVDKITEAGPVRVLLNGEDPDYNYNIRRITKLLKISIVNHHSRKVAIVAHHHCAGNPTTKKRQIRQLRRAKRIVWRIIKSFNLGFKIEIILLWVNENWMPQEIASLEILTATT